MNVQQFNTQNTQVAAQQQEVTKCGINGVFTLGGKFAACASHGVATIPASIRLRATTSKRNEMGTEVREKSELGTL